MQKKFVLIGFVLLAVVVASWFALGDKKGSGKSSRAAEESKNLSWPVNVSRAEMGRFNLHHEVIGELVLYRRSRLGFRIAGCLKETPSRIQVGQHVNVGESLAALETRDIETRIRRAQLREQELRAEMTETSVRLRGTARLVSVNKKSLQLAESLVDRLQRLKRSGTTSLSSLEQAKVDRNAGLTTLIRSENEVTNLRSVGVKLKRRLQSAQTEVELAQLDLSHAVLRAPYAGVVASQSIEGGRCLGAMQTVVEIVDPDSAQIELVVPLFVYEKMLKIGPLLGQTVSVVGLGDRQGRPVMATIMRLSPQLDQGLNSLRIYARFDDPQESAKLRAGQTLRVSIVTDQLSDVIRLPLEAVFDQGLVYIVADGMLAKREVKLRLRKSDYVYLESGVSAGEYVLTTPLRRAVTGLKVRIINRANSTDQATAQDAKASTKTSIKPPTERSP